MDRIAVKSGQVPNLTGPSQDAGVSLIELLVVVAMLSVLAVGITLPLRQSADPTRADALLFQSIYERTRAQAVHAGTRRGLQIDSRGLRLMHWGPETAGETAGLAPKWHLSEQPIRWQGRAVFAALGPTNTAQVGPHPDIIFLPNGQTSAFELRFSGLRQATISCTATGWSEVTCQ